MRFLVEQNEHCVLPPQFEHEVRDSILVEILSHK